MYWRPSFEIHEAKADRKTSIPSKIARDHWKKLGFYGIPKETTDKMFNSSCFLKNVWFNRSESGRKFRVFMDHQERRQVLVPRSPGGGVGSWTQWDDSSGDWKRTPLQGSLRENHLARPHYSWNVEKQEKKIFLTTSRFTLAVWPQTHQAKH